MEKKFSLNGLRRSRRKFEIKIVNMTTADLAYCAPHLGDVACKFFFETAEQGELKTIPACISPFKYSTEDRRPEDYLQKLEYEYTDNTN